MNPTSVILVGGVFMVGAITWFYLWPQIVFLSHAKNIR